MLDVLRGKLQNIYFCNVLRTPYFHDLNTDGPSSLNVFYLYKTIFVFHQILMKLGAVVVHNEYCNTTKFQYDEKTNRIYPIFNQIHF